MPDALRRVAAVSSPFDLFALAVCSVCAAPSDTVVCPDCVVLSDSPGPMSRKTTSNRSKSSDARNASPFSNRVQSAAIGLSDAYFFQEHDKILQNFAFCINNCNFQSLTFTFLIFNINSCLTVRRSRKKSGQSRRMPNITPTFLFSIALKVRIFYT